MRYEVDIEYGIKCSIQVALISCTVTNEQSVMLLFQYV